MTKDDRPIRNGKWRSGQLEAPTYVLYEVLDILTWYGCTLEKLGEFTFRGGLRAFCFSYTREPDRAVDIEPEQFQKLFGDPSMFAVFEGHIGDEEIDEFEQPKMPLRMIPDAVDPEIASRHDGKPIVTSKDVRIWHKVLENFVLWKFYPEAYEAQQAAETEPAAKAEPKGVDLPPSQLRRQGKYSKARVDAWYKEHVRHHQEAGVIPSREDDLIAARKKFSNSIIPRDAVRDARRRLAPDIWKKQGLRKTGG